MGPFRVMVIGMDSLFEKERVKWYAAMRGSPLAMFGFHHFCGASTLLATSSRTTRCSCSQQQQAKGCYPSHCRQPVLVGLVDLSVAFRKTNSPALPANAAALPASIPSKLSFDGSDRTRSTRSGASPSSGVCISVRPGMTSFTSTS